MDKISTARFPAKALNAIVICLVIVVFLGSACGQAVGDCGNKFTCPEIHMPPQFELQKIHIANYVSSAIHAGLSDFPKRPQESTTASIYLYLTLLLWVTAVGIGALFNWLFVRKLQRQAREWEGKYGVARHELDSAREQLRQLWRLEGQVSEFYKYLFARWPADFTGLSSKPILEAAVDKIEEMWKRLAAEGLSYQSRCRQDKLFARPVVDRKALEQIIATAEVNPDVGFPKGVKVFTDANGTTLFGVTMFGVGVRGMFRVYLHTAPPLAAGGSFTITEGSHEFKGTATNYDPRTIVRFVLDEWLTYGEVVSKLRMAGQSLIEQPKANEQSGA